MASAPIRRAKIDDLSPVQEALDWSGADEIGFIGFFDVDPGRIGFGIDGGGGDIQFTAGADDPHGDLAAIGHQNFLKHLAFGLRCSHAHAPSTDRRKGGVS